jgi:hypothetical protein
MTASEAAITVQRPPLEQSETDWRPGVRDSLAKAVKAAARWAANDYFLATAEALDALTSLSKGIQKRERQYTREEQAWLLLHGASMRALLTTCYDHREMLGPLLANTDSMNHEVVDILVREQHAVSGSLMESPKTDAFTKDLLDAMDKWLGHLGLDEPKKTKFRQVLSEEMAIALDTEWRENSGHYKDLSSYLNPTPADEAARRARNWRRYRAGLIDAVRQPVLDIGVVSRGPGDRRYEGDEAMVPLEKLFVRPRASYSVKQTVQQAEENGPAREKDVDVRYLVDLWDFIAAWPGRDRKAVEDILFLTGEAGLGKSSFTKMMAAHWARERQYSVLYVPLDRVPYDGKRDPWQAIADYARDYADVGDNLDQEIRESNVFILIIDGLDELSRSGQTGEFLAGELIQGIRHKQSVINEQDPGRFLLLCAGRPTATRQSANRFTDSGRQRLDLHRLDEIPQASSEEDFLKPSTEMHALPDPQASGEFSDQRPTWWWKFSAAVAMEPEEGIPSVFRSDDAPNEIRETFADLINQPLLSYFLALVYRDDPAGLTGC